MKLLKPKKSDRQKLIEECDDLFRELINKRDKVCRICGTTKNLQVAHIFSRSRKSVRWNPLNAVLLCVKHHLFYAHREPMLFAEDVKRMLGKDYEGLRRQAETPARGQDLALEKIYLTNELEKYDAL